MFPGEGDVGVADLDEGVAEFGLVVLLNGRVGKGGVQVVGEGVGCQRGAGGAGHDLVEIVVGIAVAVVEAGAIVKMFVAGEVDAGAGIGEAGPEGVAGGGVVIEGVCVMGGDLEGGEVAEDEDVGRPARGGELGIEPGLVDLVTGGVIVEADEQGVVNCFGVGAGEFGARAILRQVGKGRLVLRITGAQGAVVEIVVNVMLPTVVKPTGLAIKDP